MRRSSRAALAIGATVALAVPPLARPAPARASVCSVLSHVQTPLAAGCTSAARGLAAGSQLASGNVGGAVSGVVGGVAGGVASDAIGVFATAAATGARYALDETATLIRASTGPRLQAPWFARVYWRLAGISVVLTLPCLLAAVVQCLIRSDLALLVRAAFGYLPLAMLGVGVAAQLTALALAATDGLCSLVSGVVGQAAPAFLTHAGAAIVALSLVDHSPFLALMIAMFTVAGAVVVWLELMMRDAAVYVVVAMLPLAFAAFVWPARRVWALRAVELLGALILAKLAMVIVLTLGGAALESAPNAAAFLAGLVLLVLGAFSPWAMLRLIPMTELASGAVGRLRAENGPLALPEQLAMRAVDGLAAAATTRWRDGGGRARAAAESVLAGLPSARADGSAPGGGAAADVDPADSPGAEPDVAPSLAGLGTNAFSFASGEEAAAPDDGWDDRPVLELGVRRGPPPRVWPPESAGGAEGEDGGIGADSAGAAAPSGAGRDRPPAKDASAGLRAERADLTLALPDDADRGPRDGIGPGGDGDLAPGPGPGDEIDLGDEEPT